MDGFSKFFINLSIWEFLGILSLANILMYILSAVIIKILRVYFIKFDLNHERHLLYKRDYILSLQVLGINIIVGLLGWLFLKVGYIHITDKSLSMTILDALLLFVTIDLCMYLSHYLVHKTFLYRYTHQIHHEHENMTLLSLYVMHPLEAFGFGLILVLVLSFYPIDTLALLIFLFMNWILGVFAHSGIEPSKGELANYFCMTRFHQIHHENPSSNFGFYTPIMDMLLKTRSYKLKKELKDEI